MAKITLKGNEIQTSGELPKVGTKAPDFRLVNGELADKILDDYRGKKLILSINPSLDTSVCAAAAKKFNEEVGKRSDLVVLVITADLPFAQKRFCESAKAENITTLSMMRSKDFGKDYGVLITTGPLEGALARAIVVLNEEGEVLYTQLVPEITEEPNYEDALRT